LNLIAQFIKEQRKALKLSQEQFSNKAGVGLRFVRDLEQGKETVRLDKVQQVLDMFGYELAPTKKRLN
jgi:y4mF family transcriptional regulator